MKTKLLALLLSGLVGVSPNVFAHDDNEGDHDGDHHGDGQGENQDENQQGGDIDGSENLDATIALVATTNAPAGATGRAKLESENEEGVVTSSLSIETQGLAAGDYTLSVV